MVVPTPNTPPGPSLVVGTLNINGLLSKKTDLRLMLEEMGCDIMGVQETLLRSTDFTFKMPGYNCLTVLGDRQESQRGLALLVADRFNVCAVGRATPYWTFGRMYGATLRKPVIVGTIYVPCRADRRKVLRGIPRALEALHVEYPDDPIILLGDFNMNFTELQLQMATWPLPFRVLPIAENASTRRTRVGGTPTPAIDFISFYGEVTGLVPPAQILDTWDISDHYPVVGRLPDLTSINNQGPAIPPPEHLCQRILVGHPDVRKDIMACKYAWRPLAVRMKQERVAAAAENLTPAAATVADQARLDNMATQFSSTCHAVAAQLDLYQKPGGQNPTRVIAQVKRAIQARREIFKARKIADSGGDEAESARLEILYTAATLKARRAVRISGRRVFHTNIKQAHFNMRDKPRDYWRWAAGTAGWRPKSSVAGIQPVLGPDGKLLTALADIHAAWGAHYAALAADETGTVRTPPTGTLSTKHLQGVRDSPPSMIPSHKMRYGKEYGRQRHTERLGGMVFPPKC